MAKRGATSQMTKDGRDDSDEDGEEMSSTGEGSFKKADTAVLAARPMRGIPKRASVPPVSPAKDSTTKSKFASFGAPNLASNASNATKSFASFLSSPSASPAALPLAQRPSPETPKSGPDAAALKYYISLRGLNVSFITALSTAVEKDPFADVANLVESYKSLRLGVQKEFDGSLVQKPAPPAAPPSFSMPTLPKPPVAPTGGFAGWGGALAKPTESTSSTAPAPTTSGFTPKIPVPTGGFSWGGSVPSPAPVVETASSSFGKSSFGQPSTTAAPEAKTAPKPASSSNPFGTPPSNPFGAPKSAFGGSPFSTSPFGKQPDLVDRKSPIPTHGSTDTVLDEEEAAPATAGISGSGFTIPADTSSKEVGLTATASSAPTPTPTRPPISSGFGSASSLFGSSSSQTFPFASKSTPDATKPASPSSFGFGSSTRSPFKSTPSFGGTASPVGSIGNPVGFTFGSPPATPGVTTPAPATPASGSFTFGSGPAKPLFGGASTTSSFGSGDATSGSSSAGAASSTSNLFGSSSVSSTSSLFGGRGAAPSSAVGGPSAPPANPSLFGGNNATAGSSSAFGGSAPSTSGLFGSSSSTTFPLGKTLTTSSFGTSSSQEEAGATGVASGSSGDVAPPEGASMMGKSIHDEEGGPGEEDEETVHATKAHLYHLGKDAETAKPKWISLGVGFARLKHNTKTGSRRFLMRNSSTGKITLNFKIFPGVSPTLLEKVVGFNGHDDGQPVALRLRTGGLAAAKELHEAILGEVAKLG